MNRTSVSSRSETIAGRFPPAARRGSLALAGTGPLRQRYDQPLAGCTSQPSAFSGTSSRGQRSAAAVIRERLEDSFGLYDELVAELPEVRSRRGSPGLPSNAIGEQLWCVVGARESFGRAIEAGEWSGSSCSVSAAETREHGAMRAGLSRSAADVLAAISALHPSDDARCRLALRLLEHETSHHGQLIRYLYGLRLPIPAGWKERYALD